MPNGAIEIAFSQRPDLKKRTYEAISAAPELEGLFRDIAEYLTEARSGDVHGPATKKRKLDTLKTSNGAPSDNISNDIRADWKDSYALPDVSFSVPQRKKLLLQVGEGGIRARNLTTDDIEFGILWDNIQHVVCLPVPEKAQTQYSFVAFPTYGDGIIAPPEGTDPSAFEPMVWIAPEVRKKANEPTPDETYKELLVKLMNRNLEPRGKSVSQPDEKDFVSQMVQAHRKGEKAVHVKAFRGSKDGYLFFLPTGIIWAFKKPLLFFAFDTIDSVSYTSVLQRTFNLNITTRTPVARSSADDDRVQEFELSMVDQADFAGIDGYVRRHSLQDASMAEQRRAKKLAINGPKKMKDGDDKSEGELEKARREAGEAGHEEDEDEDEEEDENFDPGSEGESEGSGSSSEEDGDGRDEPEGVQGLDEDEDVNVVDEESL